MDTIYQRAIHINVVCLCNGIGCLRYRHILELLRTACHYYPNPDWWTWCCDGYHIPWRSSLVNELDILLVLLWQTPSQSQLLVELSAYCTSSLRLHLWWKVSSPYSCHLHLYRILDSLKVFGTVSSIPSQPSVTQALT